MADEKIDQILEEIGLVKGEIGSLKEGQQSLKEGQQSLKEGQQKNYGLIQKNGVRIEQLASDVKAVAEGHIVIRREMQEMKTDLKADIKEGNDMLKFVHSSLKNEIQVTALAVKDKLDEHVRLPVHAGV